MLSAEALSFRQQSRLAISLSWIGGFTNVIAFLIWKTFASHITGSSTLFGMNFAQLNFPELLLYALLVLLFLAGSICSALMTEIAKRRGVRSRYIAPLTLEAILLTALLLSLHYIPHPELGNSRYFLLPLTAFAMGLQNATITKISGAVVRSTHLTGVVTDFGIESVQFTLWAWDQLRGKIWRRAGRVLRVSQRHPSFLRLALLASIWTSFVLGSVIGALSFPYCREYALFLPITFLLWIILMDWRKPIADIRALDPLSDPDLKLHGIVHALLPSALGIYRIIHDHRPAHAPNFSFWIDKIPPEKRVIILLLSPTLKFDNAAILDLQSALNKLESKGRRLILAGITPVQYKKIAHDHLFEHIGPDNVCPDLEFAIAQANEYLRTNQD